ncbi:Uncharacterised protein [Mycobacterium tuberculosis]|nr:Uncharacterised protein [Mycobacterium tuberculosis]
MRLLPSSSSQVTTSRLLFVLAQLAYADRWRFSQASPWAIEPSCMSLSALGMTNDTVGRPG